MNITSGKFLQNCSIENAKFGVIVGFPSTKYYANHIICCVVNTFLTFSNICLNSLTLVAYWKSSQLSEKTSYFLVMVLSGNDLGVGFFCNSTFTIGLIREIMGIEDCFWPFLCVMLTLAFTGMSIMTLLILNIERYFAIIHPIYHRNKVTKRRLLAVAVSTWVFCVIMPSVLFTSAIVLRILICATVTSFLMILAFIYTNIFAIIRRSTVNASLPDVYTAVALTASALRRKEFLQKVRQAKSCLVVVICTFCCFLPSTVTSYRDQITYDMLVLTLWSMTLVFAASALNSIIFFWRNQILRNEAKSLILGHAF